jgi:hypothetical protein
MSNYRRRRGVTFRRSGGRPDLNWVNDGGHDAPMGPRDQRFFRAFFFVALIVAIALIVLMIRG